MLNVENQQRVILKLLTDKFTQPFKSMKKKFSSFVSIHPIFQMYRNKFLSIYYSSIIKHQFIIHKDCQDTNTVCNKLECPNFHLHDTYDFLSFVFTEIRKLKTKEIINTINFRVKRLNNPELTELYEKTKKDKIDLLFNYFNKIFIKLDTFK